MIEVHQQLLKSRMKARLAKIRNKPGEHPDWKLLEAVDHRDAERVQALLQAGASPNATNEHGTPALNCALYGTPKVKGGDEAMAILLLESGAEPDRPDADRATPILLACKSGFKRLVKSLLRKGVNLRAQTYGGVFSYGETALSIAAGNGNREIVRMLLEAGADVNQPLRKGVTALASAAASGDVTIVRELIAAGGKASGIALFAPIRAGRVDILTELIAAGADVNVVDRWGNSVLGSAVQSGHIGIVQAVIRAGAKLDVVSGGRTPLILAVCNERAELVKSLLAAGAKVDARDIYRCTAAMEAAVRSDVAVLKMLLAAGANPRLKNKNGKTAISLAGERGMSGNIEILEHAARPATGRARHWL